MMKNFNWTPKKLYTIIVIGFLLIGLLNFISWFFLQSFKKELIVDLKEQIKNTGEISTRLVNGNDISQISVGDEYSPIVRYYQQLLYDLKLENHHENIIILDLTGKLLVDFRIDYEIGNTEFTFPLNASNFNQAILGNAPDPILNKFEDQYFLSAYLPIFNDLLEPVAVLIIDAPLRFFATLQKFETGTFYVGAGGLLLLIVFSLLTFFSTRRLIRIERDAKDNEHLVELGQMAASVAHEIRNPLSIMKGTADVLKKKYGSDEDELFSFIPSEINRLNRLVEDFLSFARRKKISLSKVDLVKLVRELTPDNSVVFEFDSKIPAIEADPDAIRQIYLNLLRNAQDAVKTGGQVTVKINRSGRSGKQIKFSIEDNGCGIPADQIDKIFDPFFTTKSTGSGLGLSISKQLIDQMGGKIQIESEAGAGTKIEIFF